MEKRLLALLIVMLLLVTTIGCTAPYKETVAKMQETIFNLEQKVEELESQNEILQDTIKELEAEVAKAEPTSKPNVDSEMVSQKTDLGMKLPDFVEGFANYLFLYDGDDRPEDFDELMHLKFTDFTSEDKIDDLTPFVYNYKNVSYTINVDEDLDVYSILIIGNEFFNENGEINRENANITIGLQYITLLTLYGEEAGEALAEDLIGGEDMSIVEYGNYHGYALDSEALCAILYIDKEE